MASAASPLFSAVSSSARQLQNLLRCLDFAKKTTVQISHEGLRFSAEDAKVMQGLVFLDKALFTSFVYNTPTHDALSGSDVGNNHPAFQISLPALLETLQVFGGSDASLPIQAEKSAGFRRDGNAGGHHDLFTTPALSLSGSCRITYMALGLPLNITLTDNNCTTTCSLTTYVASDNQFQSSPPSIAEEIPLQRDALTLKIIMRAAWLADAVTELATTNPTILTISASPVRPPFFALGAEGGPFSDSTVEFDIDKNSNITKAGRISTDAGHPSSFLRQTRLAPTVTETFQVVPAEDENGRRQTRVKQQYRFELIRKATRAMQLADKVSIRGDRAGVLSLQFMIYTGGAAPGTNGANVVGATVGQTTSASLATSAVTNIPGDRSFVDFRFVPLLDEDEPGESEEDRGGATDEEMDNDYDSESVGDEAD